MGKYPGHTLTFSGKVHVVLMWISCSVPSPTPGQQLLPRSPTLPCGLMNVSLRQDDWRAERLMSPLLCREALGTIFDCQFNYNCESSNETATLTDVSWGCRPFPGERNQSSPPLAWSFSGASFYWEERCSSASLYLSDCDSREWADRRPDVGPADEPSRER